MSRRMQGRQETEASAPHLERKRPYNPESQIVAPVFGVGSAATGHTKVSRIVDPGPSAQITAAAISGLPGRPVGGCTVVAVVPTILRPLVGVAGHIVQAERIGRKA